MSSESHRPAKRSRDETSNEEVVKHGSLYHYDGDIVLLSLPSTKDNVITAFKVDKIFLSRHSSVFKGMLSLPSPEDAEKYDDVPLVRLQDQADHLASFLIAVYDATSLPFAKHGSDTIGKLEGVIKLATKYQVDALRQRAVDLVSADWPSDLDSWDVNEAEIGHLELRYTLGRGTHLGPFDAMLPEPCEAIRLAREYDIKKILPAAFLHLSRIPPRAGIDWSEGDEDDAYSYYIWSQGRTANFSLLSSQDLTCLLLGIRRIVPAVLELATEAQGWVAKKNCSAKTLENHKTCVDILDAFTQKLRRDAAGYSEYHYYDPLDSLLCKNLSRPGADGFCSSCLLTFTSAMRQARFKLWDRLPALFGLEE